jgi:hypothetical protein
MVTFRVGRATTATEEVNVAYPGLVEVSGKYGAPMGRLNRIPTVDVRGVQYCAPVTERLHLRRLDFIDGCYDTGGAYWGSPANLYHCTNSDRTVEVFVRANSRAEAKANVRELLPTARFFR